VFDIETTLDEGAAAAAGYKGNGIPSALQRITTACLLVAKEDQDGNWTSITLKTLSAPSSEFEILMRLDEELASLASHGATLISYNGRAHDLAILRRRGARHWMFGLPGITSAATMDHLDIMLRQRIGRRDGTPTLREACGGLGISAFDPRQAGTGRLPPIAKCQIDVVATFLLALYEIAIERGSPNALLGGWEGLSKYLTRLQPRAAHLEHFRNHPLLQAAQRAHATS
jgi:hypothetical protein